MKLVYVCLSAENSDKAVLTKTKFMRSSHKQGKCDKAFLITVEAL